jgi:transposase
MVCFRKYGAAMDLTDDQWAIIQPLVPNPTRRFDGKGRPWKDPRDVMNGILWILRTGAPWYDMPKERYPSFQTCHRRFQQWVHSGIFEKILQALSTDLRERGGLNMSECYIDGTFIVAKKGGKRLERPSGAKVRSSWQYQTALVFLSPYTLRLLHHMKSPLLKQLSPSVLSLIMKSQNV